MKPWKQLGPTMKERDVLLSRLGLREAVLVHYDIGETNTRLRTALNRFLSGRVDRRPGKRGAKIYRYPGLIAHGAEKGWSVRYAGQAGSRRSTSSQTSRSRSPSLGSDCLRGQPRSSESSDSPPPSLIPDRCVLLGRFGF